MEDVKPGARFGYWTITSEPFRRTDLRTSVLAVHATCDCGAEGRPQVAHLLGGMSTQCRTCGRHAPRVNVRGRVSAGERFGAWTVIDRPVRTDWALCRCSCGAEHRVKIGNLTRGMSTRCKQCGYRTMAGEAHPHFKHGMSGANEYKIWRGMINRCHLENDPGFPFYGARGIQVCDEWRGPGGFERFFAHIGPRPSKQHSVDRINNDGNYEPGNVRWATRKQQARNTRRSRLLPLGGQLVTMEEAGQRLGISRQGIHSRLANGWTPLEAATTPKGSVPPRLQGQRGARTRREYQCGRCGEHGHNARTCATDSAEIAA